jgi:DNA repair exonuclease SbcCD ATPase subunit
MSNTETEEFDFDPQYEDEPVETSPEDEPIVEASADEVPDEIEASEPEPEPEVDATPRAQKRIQKLASQKKELEGKNEELLALVEQLKKSNELTAEMQKRQTAYLDQQQAATQQQSRQQIMRQYGLKPEETRDAYIYDMIEYQNKLENQYKELQSQIQEQQAALQVERFDSALTRNLETKLKAYKVDADVLAGIRETAYDIARVKNLTADEAADAAFSRYKGVLPKAAVQKRKPISAADKAVAMGNRSKVKAPEVDTSELGFLDMLDSGNFRV